MSYTMFRLLEERQMAAVGAAAWPHLMSVTQVMREYFKLFPQPGARRAGGVR
jgi:hypothetical protein